MDKSDIKVVLEHLYNDGKISIKEKSRIMDLSLEAAMQNSMVSNAVYELVDGRKLETTIKSVQKEESELDLLKKLVSAQQLQLNKLELIRANLSKLVWWFIVIPLIVLVVSIILGIGI